MPYSIYTGSDIRRADRRRLLLQLLAILAGAVAVAVVFAVIAARKLPPRAPLDPKREISAEVLP